MTQNLAEEQEKVGAKESAIEFYSQAAELFSAEDSTAEASKCRQKVSYLNLIVLFTHNFIG